MLDQEATSVDVGFLADEQGLGNYDKVENGFKIVIYLYSLVEVEE